VTGKVLVAADRATLMNAAAEEVASRAAAAVAARGRFAVALAGGSTPRTLYALLADPAAPYRERMPWAATHVFFGDERCVPPSDAASNYGMAWRALLSRVPVPHANVHRMRGELEPDEAARDYERELGQVFPPSAGLPRFDVILLGLGGDGHTASLFPGTAALEERERLAVANASPDGLARVTLTYPVLDAARSVLFVVAGDEKAERVADVLERGADLPAARVAPADGELLWLLDASAAARLERAVPRVG
jgi:6-phosphogluconolactonase